MCPRAWYCLPCHWSAPFLWGSGFIYRLIDRWGPAKLVCARHHFTGAALFLSTNRSWEYLEKEDPFLKYAGFYWLYTWVMSGLNFWGITTPKMCGPPVFDMAYLVVGLFRSSRARVLVTDDLTVRSLRLHFVPLTFLGELYFECDDKSMRPLQWWSVS